MSWSARRAGRGRPRGPVLRVVAGLSVGLVALLLGLFSGLPAIAAPATTPAQSSGQGLEFSTDPSDILNGFERDSYNEKAGPPQVVASPNIPGQQAILFSVAPEAQRCEVVPNIPHQHEGDTLYFGYNGYLASGFPIDADQYQIFMQWHHEGNDGSPPISVNARDNKLELAGGDNDPHPAYEKSIVPIKAGSPVNLVLKIVFSQDPSKGSIDVWSGGRQVVSNFHPPGGTMYDDGDYLKTGMYRDTALPGTANVYLNSLAVGTDYATVQKAIGGTSSPEASGSTEPSTEPPSASDSHDGGDSGFSTGLVVGGALVAAIVAIALAVAARNRRRRI